MRPATPLLLALLLAAAARAQTPGDCALGQARADLAISDVRATLFNTGSLFFGDGVQAGYVVPVATGHSPIFAAGIWIGGKVNGEVRTAGATYTNFEFWPGPLDEGATLPEPDCRRANANGREAWDRVYVVSVLDVEAYEQTGVATDDLADWPVGLGAPAVDAAGDPVVPTSRDQLIDLEAGERPVVYGGETAFWVMNDVGNDHAETGSAPLGVEVRVLAFAVPGSGEEDLDRGTFYRYTVVNRNSHPITDAYFSLFGHTTLGDGLSQYVGTDTTRGMAFTYGGTLVNPVYGIPPAVGYDFLGGGLGAHSFWGNVPGPAVRLPTTAAEYYNRMQGLWNDGTPMTEGGNGYQTGGDVTTFAFPGDPVTGQFWSEVDEDNSPGKRWQVAHSPAFTLQPGEARTFDLAVVFAQGTDYLDSVTRLRAASDLVQARYDDGSLFDTVDPDVIEDPPSEAPALVAPPDGAVFTEGDVHFDWQPVPGATYYLFELDTSPGFPSPERFLTAADALTLTRGDFPVNHIDPFYWRVQGANTSGEGPSSQVRSLTYYFYVPTIVGDGDGIIETAYGGDPDVCPGVEPDDPGCAGGLGGNTVWRPSVNATGDYAVGSNVTSLVPGNPAPSVQSGLYRYIEAATPDDFEMRFTEEGSLGVYALGDLTITRLPFELWNVGDPDDPDDDVRMIAAPLAGTGCMEYAEWVDSRACEENVEPYAGFERPSWDLVYWYMPDRPDGYDRFEAAALAFGGPGATYDRDADGDTQVDTSAFYGAPCANQGVYIDFCYRDDALTGYYGGFPDSGNVYPIGRFRIIDVAGDATPPPPGTTIRILTSEPKIVAAEPPVSGIPEAYTLRPVYPNPTRGRAVVPFVVPTAGRVRVAVYDVLGREVAVLADGLHGAGAHEAVLDGAGLASGVYVVVLEGEAARATRKLTILR